MSSSEQAPEPTMDEILASIRKIISDDEPEQGAQANAAAAEMPAAESLGDGLSGAMSEAPAVPAAAEEADDILDLTQVVQPQAETPATPEPVSHAPQPATDGPPRGDDLQAALAGSAAPNQGATHQDNVGSDIAALLAEAGVEDTLNEAGSSATGSSAEETSITEALRAMDDEEFGAAAAPVEDASMSEGGEASVAEAPDAFAAPAFTENPDDTLSTDDLSAALEATDSPVTDPLAAAEAVVDASQDLTGEAIDMPAIEMPAPETSPALEDSILAEPEVQSTEAEIQPARSEPVAQPMESDDDVLEAPSDFAAPDTSEPEIAAAAESISGDDASDTAFDAGEAAPASFEQGIKDMLKPMLSKWLDDNMERIVHDAVKEQVTSDGSTEK